MLIKKKKHKVPGINAASMADVSFMLLFFFLVTTSMDVDKGLIRQIPPPDEPTQPPTIVESKQLLAFNITAEDIVLMNGNEVSTDTIRDFVEKFVERIGYDHLITIETDPNSSYNAYFNLENEIVGAYNIQRDKTAQKLYGKNYSECTDDEQMEIRDASPQHIAEIPSGIKEEGATK